MDDIFALVGRALFHAQEFERVVKGVANALHAIENHDGGPLALSKFSDQALGPTLVKCGRWLDFCPKGESILEEARQRRNALCHGWFEKHAVELDSPTGRQALAASLQDDIRWFQSGADVFRGCGEALIQIIEEDIVE